MDKDASALAKELLAKIAAPTGTTAPAATSAATMATNLLNRVAPTATTEVPTAAAPDLTADLTRQAGLAGRYLAQGAAGIGGMVYDPLAATQNYLIGSEGLLPLVNDVAPLRQQVSQILTSAGVPEPAGLAERIIGAISEGMVGSAGMAGVAKGAANLFTGAGKAVSNVLAAQPGAQIAAGGASGFGAQAAAEAGAGPVGQIAASMAGGLAGGRAAGLGVAAPQVGLPAAIKEAEQAGVRVMTTDVRQPTTFAGKWLQRTGEMIPVAGTGGPRAAQQQERIDASVDLLRNYGVNEVGAADNAVIASVTKDLLDKRLSDITKYTGMKGDVIKRLSQPNVTVPVTKSVAKIDEEIARLNQISPTQFKPVIDRLMTWRDDLTGTREVNLPNGQKQVVQQGQPLATIEVLRKQIGEAFADPSLASVRSEGERVLNSIYKPLREDMGDFIKASGQRRDFDKWSVANKQLSRMMDDLEVNAVRNVLDRGNATPEAVRTLLFSKKPSDIRALYRNLSADGKRNARTAILQEAFTKIGGEFESLSPDKFKRQLVDLGAPVGVFFSGQDLKAVEGLVRTLKMTEQAGRAGVSTPTGERLALPVLAAYLTQTLGDAGAALTTGATIGGLARVYESAPVRNLLLKIPQVAAGSAEEAELFKRLTSAMNAQKATESEPRQ